SDGGVVEISTDAGSTWQDLETKWIMNAYNGRISSTFSTPLTSRKAFTGSSQKYINSIADLSAFVNQSVLVRFRFASDAVTNGTGWFVDDVLVADQTSLDSEVCMTSGEGDQHCTKERFMVLFSTPVESEKPVLPITHEIEGIWPNPFAGEATLRLRVAKPQGVRIAIHDLLGRKVGEVFDGVLAAGEWRTFTLDGIHLPNGVYFCRIAGETFSEVQKIILLR
ncbi:MAG TPA: T9SS type A sorting domain-containing protein, partial [Rhodothermales bacterium]|nr:T9SS type A sorting domain-containing protein [Rhodothermales bacterium]